MTLRQYDNAARGLEYSRQLTSSDFRSIVTVLWNVNRGKSPAKSAEQLWPLPLIDTNRPVNVLNTRQGKIDHIKSRGYSGVEKLTNEELKWFWGKAIIGNFGFNEDEVKQNRKEVKRFCKQKGIGNSKRESVNNAGSRHKAT